MKRRSPTTLRLLFFAESLILLCLLPPAVPVGAGEAEGIDHIVLTGGDSVTPDQEISGPVELRTQTFVLRFSAEGKPVSLKARPEGKELLNTARASDGFYLACASGKVFFSKLLRRGDGKLVFKTANETQQIVISGAERDQYLVFRIEELIGIPSACAFTLHFGMEADAGMCVFGLDYMTSADRVPPVNWYWIWHRHPDDPLGAFALYRKTGDADEDETLLRIWVNEELPHPQLEGAWTLERARQWVKDWMREFADTSVLWYGTPETEEELLELLPYLQQAGIREVHLMPWTWSSGRHHCEINEKFFKRGRAGFREYVKLLNDKGLRVTLHYDFCGIPFDDPIYVGTKPNEGLARWGRGTLIQAVGTTATTLLFQPDAGTELPFMMDPFHYRVNPPALATATHFNFVRIGDEIVRVGRFKNTNTRVWTLEGCERGLGATEPAAYPATQGVTGLVAMFGVLFIPEANSELFRQMTGELTDLMNECHISHVEYDGVNPGYASNAQWMYRKYLGQVYSGLDHPVSLGTGYGEARPFGYFEYELNAVRKMQGHELGPRGDIGARIRTYHLSRPASTVDETQFRMSQVAAFDNPSFPLFFEFHYPSQWRQHGRFAEICALIADWKAVSRRLSAEQRERIRKTLVPPNARGYQSDIVWRLRRDGEGYKIYPGKNPLTRDKGDIRWGCGGGEMGYLTPVQYIKPGQELRLENPYAAQAPQFTIQVLSAVNYDDRENLSLQPELAALQNPTETGIAREGEALVFTAVNRRDSLLDNRDGASLYPSWSRSVDMSSHRALGMWLTGDNSGAVFVLRLPGNRDYAVPLTFAGRRYIEIPNGEAYWVDAAWGGPGRSCAVRYDYKPEWFKLGFGEIPAGAAAQVKLEGLKALKETSTELRNPVVHVGGGSLTVQGSIKTEQYLEYCGGIVATVYDRNWNRVTELPVKLDNYSMPTGWQVVSVTAARDAPQPWLAVRFITEGEPIIVTR